MSAGGGVRRRSRAAIDPRLYALGHRIRATRLEAGIGLRELARRVGCSPGLVSKIEHGTVAPSVATLYAITRELRVPMDTLFTTSLSHSKRRKDSKTRRKEYDLVRAAEGEKVRLPHGVQWRRLAAGDNQSVEFREITYQPGATSNAPGQMLQHDGQEHGIVIEGRFNLQIGEETLELSPGDAIAFSAQIPHRLRNPGKVVARAIWLVHPGPAINHTPH